MRRRPAKLVGYWRKTPSDDSDLPHPQYLRSPGWLSPAEKSQVLHYLRSGHEIAYHLGVSFCRIVGGPPDDEMGSSELSDGEWIWPEGLSIYVERFDVRLPEEFIDHMRAHRHIVPSLDATTIDQLLEHASAADWIAWGKAQEGR